MRAIARLFILPWYLIGWTLHVYFAILAPEVYRSLGSTAILPGYSELWRDTVMPYISHWAILLAAFELVVGCLLLASGRYLRVGLVLSIAFNLFLVQMGLGYQSSGDVQSFLINRLPNLVFAGIQVPLLFGREARSAPALVRGIFAFRNGRA